MPYTAYAALTDEDVHALYSYFMQGVPAVDQPTAPTRLPFPMNIRLSMKAWNLLFLDGKPYMNDPQQSAQWNRGRYLVEGPGHCSTCHTPRGFLMQEKTSQLMAGAQVGPWFAPNITSDPTAGIGTWSHDDLVTYLKTGRLEGKAQAAGSMAEAITHSFSHLHQQDLSAIATYIKAIPASPGTAGNQPDEARFQRGTATNELETFRGQGYAKGMQGESLGAQLYSGNCSSCHGYQGQGTADQYYPSLFSNSATAGVNPTNLIATILYGVDRKTDTGHVFMSPFGSQPNAVNALKDDEVAALSNYILRHYGNAVQTVSAKDVAVIQDGGPGSNLLLLARLGMGAGVLAAVVGIGLMLRRRAKGLTSGFAPQS